MGKANAGQWAKNFSWINPVVLLALLLVCSNELSKNLLCIENGINRFIDANEDEAFLLMLATEACLIASLESLSDENTGSIQEKKAFTCAKCSETFTSRSNLRNHINSEHVDTFVQKFPEGTYVFTRDSISKQFTCLCGSKFKSSCGTYYHRKCVHNYVAKKYSGN